VVTAIAVAGAQMEQVQVTGMHPVFAHISLHIAGREVLPSSSTIGYASNSAFTVDVHTAHARKLQCSRNIAFSAAMVQHQQGKQ
jgi:hypothetical protein